MSEPKQEDGSRINSGMTRREPRWVTPFLRALERTGAARASAEDAGIDHTTAYLRRRTHSDFALAWAEALRAHRERVEREREEELEAIRTSPPLPARALRESPSPAEGGGIDGEELVGAGSQMKRAGHGRWSARKEKIFFDELAATANIRRSAAAAGVSYNAAHARRLKHPVFAAKWEAVVQTAKASINMHLLEQAKKSFDPDELDTGDVQPRVTIDQAIKISQGGAARKQEEASDPFAPQASAESADEIRHRLVQKLRRYRQREMPKWLSEGWSYDESYDHMVPPGWVKGPDYRPKEAGDDNGLSRE